MAGSQEWVPGQPDSRTGAKEDSNNSRSSNSNSSSGSRHRAQKPHRAWRLKQGGRGRKTT